MERTIPKKDPVSGIVKSISVNSKGAIVAPGVTVAEIVPEDEKLIIEANLPLSEIGYVKKGLEAKNKIKYTRGFPISADKSGVMLLVQIEYQLKMKITI